MATSFDPKLGHINRNIYKCLFFIVAPCFLILSSLYIYATDVQLDCSKRMSQFTLKFTSKCSYIFRFYNHHQGANVCALTKVMLLK